MRPDFEVDHAQAAGTAPRVGLTGRIPVNALIDLATIEEDAQIGTIQGGFFFHAGIASTKRNRYHRNAHAHGTQPSCEWASHFSTGANWIKRLPIQ